MVSSEKIVAEEGFTLLEMLVAMMLLAMISFVMFGALRFGIRTWERTEILSTQIDEIRVTRSLLRNLISEAYPSLDISDPTLPHVMFVGKKHSLEFLARGPVSIQSPGMNWFRIFFDDSSSQSALRIDWRSELAQGVNHAAKENDVALLHSLRDVEFSYFGSIRPDITPRWRSEWDGMQTLPQLVRVRLRLAKNYRRDWLELIVEPRVTMDNACIYDPVSRNCRRR